MDIINIFTYHENVRELFNKFIKVFNFKMVEDCDYIIFSSQNLTVEFTFENGYYSDIGINYYISYIDKNKQRKVIYNEIFWKEFERTTKFWFMHGDSNKHTKTEFYTIYCNKGWTYNSLMRFINLLTSKKLATLIENDYFYNKQNDFKFDTFQKEDNYFLNRIFNEYKKYTIEEYKAKVGL